MPLLFGARFVNSQPHACHGATNTLAPLLWRKVLQADICRQFHVDAYSIGVAPRFLNQLLGGIGDSLEVYIPAEVVVLAQRACDADQLLHRVVRVADDAGGQKQSFDVVALVKVQCQPHHFLD